MNRRRLMFRNSVVRQLRKEGWTIGQIASEFEITKQRVDQIINHERFNRRRKRWRHAKRLADQSSV